MTKILKLVVATGILTASASAVFAETPFEDIAAQSYINTFPKASLKEARDIMSGERQREVSDVYNCVKDIEGFAGLETRHVPKYRVVVKFTKQPEKKLRYCTSNKRVFKSTGAALSLSDLENIVDIAKSELGATSISNEAFLSLSRNRVTVRVKKEDLKLAKMTGLPP